ncbi:MAG: 16S rRNA (guanine(527)-N(7))-methyltransferase RsmG [Anaerolineae bacterium]|nr:MAG: 16S rRNA (guanine(527)-N(7))-methyltransferase RsmG [Anaerolineae bacterium]
MDELHEEARQGFGLNLSDAQLVAFSRYAAVLTEWNERINLTAIREPRDVRVKHFLDSLSCIRAFTTAPESLIDVGTGAGFPGLVLKIIYPDLKLTLVESVGKKARFLEQVVQELGLTEVTVLARRAEEVGQDPAHRERYEWAAARAVAQLPVLVEYLLPLVRVGGWALAQKGDTASDELGRAKKAIQQLGGRDSRVERVQVPGLDDERYLVILEKKRATPREYPRLPGTPSKKPLV